MKHRIPDVPDYEAIRPRAVLLIEAGGKRFYASLESSPAAAAFTDILNSGALTVEMQGEADKEAPLPHELPRSDRPTEALPGDILLCGNRLVLCCDKSEQNCTRLARIGNVSKEKLLEALGESGAQVRFSLEWSE